MKRPTPTVPNDSAEGTVLSLGRDSAICRFS